LRLPLLSLPPQPLSLLLLLLVLLVGVLLLWPIESESGNESRLAAALVTMCISFARYRSSARARGWLFWRAPPLAS
jgi:hypothetical protein